MCLRVIIFYSWDWLEKFSPSDWLATKSNSRLVCQSFQHVFQQICIGTVLSRMLRWSILCTCNASLIYTAGTWFFFHYLMTPPRRQNNFLCCASFSLRRFRSRIKHSEIGVVVIYYQESEICIRHLALFKGQIFDVAPDCVHVAESTYFDDGE